MAKIPMKNKKRLVIAFSIFALVLVLLSVKAGYVQIVKGEEYAKKARQQQTKDEMVESKRGEILDRNGNKLAVSTVKYAIWVRPSTLKFSKNKDKNEERIEKVSRELSQILSIDEDKLKKELNGKIPLAKVAKYVERKEADKVRAWALKEKLDGITITEETKRIYPLDEFASHLLGSVTDDNNGLSGIEQYYNTTLKGTDGRWIQEKDVNGNSLAYGDEKYYEAEDGKNIVLTIDVAIQNYTEKAIKKTMKKEKATRVSAIVMNPKTGEVLAMASTPSFNPNNSRVPINKKDAAKLKKLDDKGQLDYLNNMWRNPLVNDTYIPGSTLKLVTTSAALEEDLTTLNEGFYCNGYINAYGTEIKCWSYLHPHGAETLKEAVGNSCNPVFVELTDRIKKDKFYDYLDLFGYTETTGIDYPGEALAQVKDKNTLQSPVDFLTMGFGQGINVTPIQHLTALCSLGNKGKLMQPYLVKKIEDSNGKTVKEIKPKEVRQTVSEETASKLCDIMEFVVAKGGAQKAKIDGYRVGGKTGTSTVETANNKKYIASFVGMAPMEDPQIAVLYIVENPGGGAIFGSTIAAPGAQEIMESSLKYLRVKESEESTERHISNAVTVPDIVGKKASEAKKLLSEKKLKYKISSGAGKDFIVKDQYPKAGDNIKKGGVIYIYEQ